MGESVICLDIEELPEGVWLATSEDVPGLVVEGRTMAEAIDFARDAIRKLAESYLEHGDPLPPALTREAPKHLQVQVAVGVA